MPEFEHVGNPRFERVVNRGAVYYIHQTAPPTGSREINPKNGRPAIVVSRETDNFLSGTVEIVYLTGAKNVPNPRETQVKLTTDRIIHSVAKCEQVTTVDKKALGDYIVDLNEKDAVAVDCAMLSSLQISQKSAAQFFGFDKTISTLTSRAENAERERDRNNLELADLKKVEVSLREQNKALQEKLDTCASGEDYKEKAERFERMYKDLVQTLAGRT